jgi:hypothetical protein
MDIFDYQAIIIIIKNMHMGVREGKIRQGRKEIYY